MFSNRFSVFVWTNENDLKTLPVDVNFFENGEKKLRFQTKADTCGRGLRLSRVGFFENAVFVFPCGRVKRNFSKTMTYEYWK